VARRGTHCAGEKPAQSRIGFALKRRGAHPRLEHCSSIGAPLDALNSVSPTARRKPHDYLNAAWRWCPRQL